MVRQAATTALCAAALVAWPPRPARAQSTFASELQVLLTSARIPGARWPDFAADIDDVTRLYAQRHDTPLWSAQGPTAAARQAIAVLSDAGVDGLDPADYDASQLDAIGDRLSPRSTTGEQARFDLLLTVDLIRYYHDLAVGREGPNADFASVSMPVPRFEPGRAIAGAAADSATAIASLLRPRWPQYAVLQRALLRARADSAASIAAANHVRPIELALERLRWLPAPRPGPVVMVNVPAFELAAYDSIQSDIVAFRMRVVVGRVSWPTPMIAEQLRYLDFHPSWIVPHRIAVEEIIPAVRKHRRYLAENDMDVMIGDSVLGDSLPPALQRRLIHGDVAIRQRPTARNALGPIRFVFPNRADVYLHGTPETALFARSRRALSHGCIRVQHPAALAAWVLRDMPAWPLDSVRAAIASPVARRVFLARPIPVIVMYATAAAVGTDSVAFYPDVYGDDRRLDQAMRTGEHQP